MVGWFALRTPHHITRIPQSKDMKSESLVEWFASRNLPSITGMLWKTMRCKSSLYTRHHSIDPLTGSTRIVKKILWHIWMRRFLRCRGMLSARPVGFHDSFEA